jgi:hypothetical protein
VCCHLSLLFREGSDADQLSLLGDQLIVSLLKDAAFDLVYKVWSLSNISSVFVWMYSLTSKTRIVSLYVTSKHILRS